MERSIGTSLVRGWVGAVELAPVRYREAAGRPTATRSWPGARGTWEGEIASKVDQVLILRLLDAAWGGAVPPRVVQLLDPSVCVDLIEDFKLGLVFPFGGGPVRLTLSSQGEPAAWTRRVHGLWPYKRVRRFLGLVPPGARRMVDTDGDSGVLYLDDLQDLPGGATAELMCLTLAVPTGGTGRITRHLKPPMDLLVGELRDRVRELVRMGAKGLWGIRRAGRRVSGVLWVSESRWRGDPDHSARVVAGLGEHPGWTRALRVLEDAGLVGYPDGVELLADGGVDVTLGILRAS